MESNTTIYPPGETVWVKIPNCPWWPAEVVCESDCPLECEFRGKKTTVAVVKFLNEDYYYIIQNPTKIQPFLVPNYEKLKLKAEKDKRESIRTKIGPAFKVGLKRVGLSVQEDNEDGADDSNSKICTDPSNRQTDDVKQIPDNNQESEELGRGSRKRKQVEKYIPRLPDFSPKHTQRGKKRRTMSTGSLSPRQANSRNSSLSSMTNSPSIPYPSQELALTENGKKSSVVSRVNVQNSLGAAVKRSLEAEYASSASVSSTEDTFPAESVGVQFPSPTSERASLPGSRSLQFRFPGKQKFTSVANQGRDQLGHQSGSDIADSIGPDHNDQCKDNKQPTSVSFSCCSSSVSSYDSNLDSEASESDEELPEGLSPSVVDTSSMPAVRDVVWVKYRHFNFWPAVVRRIQKSRGKPKKVQIQFLGGTSHFKENFYVTYRKDVVLPLDNPRRKEFEDAGRQCANEDTKKRFISSLMEVEAYLNKKALGLLPPNKEDSFFNEDYESDVGETRSSEETCPTSQDDQANSSEDRDRLSMPAVTTKKTERKHLNNNSCQMMKEKRKKKNQILLEFILSDDMKSYLLEIYNGQRKCERHTQYHSSVRERDRLRHSGFGPIADEEQQDQITYTFVEWYKDCASSTVDIDYILDVWVPEALVYSLIKRRAYGRSRAWEVFNKGCRLYKIEQREIHKHLITTARNISPADARRYNERLQERMAMTLAS